MKEREFKNSKEDLDSLRSRLKRQADSVATRIERYNKRVGQLATRDSIRNCDEADRLPDFVEESRVLMDVVPFNYGRFDDAIQNIKESEDL